MSALIVEEDVRSEHFEDPAFRYPAKEECVIDDDSPLFESENSTLMRRSVACGHQRDP